MDFIDYLKIYVKAGKGGSGSGSFKREKYVPKGGPDGGHGGNGGNIIIKASTNVSSFLPIISKRSYNAPNGKHGSGKNMHGKNGADIVIKVPVGTQVFDYQSGELLTDLDVKNSKYIAKKGGNGGIGNVGRRSDNYEEMRASDSGKNGEEGHIVLELKSICDVGLIGMPNAGKSSIIRLISNSKSEIGHYEFTTKIPHLGFVEVDKFEGFTVADLPGMIEHASKNYGLGIRFLKHAERCNAVCHVVDISNKNYMENYKIIRNELTNYSSDFLNKNEFIILNKYDLISKKDLDKALLYFVKLKKKVKDYKIVDVFATSTVDLKFDFQSIMQKIFDTINQNQME